MLRKFYHYILPHVGFGLFLVEFFLVQLIIYLYFCSQFLGSADDSQGSARSPLALPATDAGENTNEVYE